jgi:hypothetical protein
MQIQCGYLRIRNTDIYRTEHVAYHVILNRIIVGKKLVVKWDRFGEEFFVVTNCLRRNTVGVNR